MQGVPGRVLLIPGCGDVTHSDGRHTALTSNYICTPSGPRGSVDFPIFWGEEGREGRGADGGEEGGRSGWRLERDREADGILFVPLM